jgi:hypothetical protein
MKNKLQQQMFQKITVASLLGTLLLGGCTHHMGKHQGDMMANDAMSGEAVAKSEMAKSEKDAMDMLKKNGMGHENMIKMSPEEMKKAMQKAAMPVQEHAALKDYAGTWNTTAKFWMDPSAKPEVSKGTSTITLEHGDKFLKESYKGMWNGAPFTGTGFTGFDTVSKEYTSIWMDSASPVISNSTGQFMPGTKTLVLSGSNTCPMSGAKLATKMVNRVVNKNKHVLENYVITPDGKEVKNMEITYDRAVM